MIYEMILDSNADRLLMQEANEQNREPSRMPDDQSTPGQREDVDFEFRPMEIQGEPLAETVLRDRR